MVQGTPVISLWPTGNLEKVDALVPLKLISALSMDQ